MTAAAKKQRASAFVATIDPAELAVRLCEANYLLKRPMADANSALAAMDEDVRIAWLRSAKAAADYFVEIVNAAEREQ
jgi:roadblock/LC7 domain-containing protein